MLAGFGTDLLNIIVGVTVLLGILIIGFFIFSKLTSFNDIEEIKKGNVAAGIYMGSKMLSLCIIIAMVSFATLDWLQMIVWSIVGIAILSIVYLVFDFLTPAFKIGEEMAAGNKAVALLLSGIIIGTSLVIGTYLL